MNVLIPVSIFYQFLGNTAVYTPSFARACRKASTLSRATMPTNWPFSTTGSWFTFDKAIWLKTSKSSVSGHTDFISFKGIMAVPTVVLAHFSREMALISFSVIRPVMRSPPTTGKQRRPLCRTTSSTSFCRVIAGPTCGQSVIIASRAL